MVTSLITLIASAVMNFTLPALKYDKTALEPTISAKTIEYHYGKHLQTYIDNLNKLIDGTPYQGKSLEEIVRTSNGALFNNAAQSWNHIFYFEQFTATPHEPPFNTFPKLFTDRFESMEQMKKEMNDAGALLFGSGWVWLSVTPKGELVIEKLGNAGCPLTEGNIPLLTIDVWEHAYYLDYKNRRAEYLQNIWKLIDWNVVIARYHRIK